jgi:HEPN domain-containing protein
MAELIWYIVHMTAPERVFLLQGKGRNTEENLVHLLITVPGNNRRNFSELQTIIELCRLKTSTVYISIYHASQWREYVERGCLFYCRASKSEYLVYEAPDASLLTMPTPEVTKVAIESAKESFLNGHAKAQTLMKLADQLQQEQNNSLSAFMYQQSAELCLRSLIFAATGQECRTHSIAVLNKHMSRYAPELCSYFAGGNDFEDGLIRLLDHSYTGGRYNSEFKVPDQYLEAIKERIPQLLNAALGAFEELLKRAEASQKPLTTT